jgi:hypothetical protein
MRQRIAPKAKLQVLGKEYPPGPSPVAVFKLLIVELRAVGFGALALRRLGARVVSRHTILFFYLFYAQKYRREFCKWVGK